jgi:hypothetical protein
MTKQPNTSPTLLTVRQFSERHPAFSQGALRNLIYHSRPRAIGHERIRGNGLDVAIIRVGRRILLDERKFFEWLVSQQEKAA